MSEPRRRDTVGIPRRRRGQIRWLENLARASGPHASNHARAELIGRTKPTPARAQRAGRQKTTARKFTSLANRTAHRFSFQNEGNRLSDFLCNAMMDKQLTCTFL